MENKKALVIIPPYSEPLKKLGQILSTPEEAENIDIYVLEDLKEAGQLIPTLGQCLIVIANAKKCALFLQENRWAISKNHSKVILMSAKEIPQKTLMKFLKIGLTEVILETLPPKSLLYKIKLLLRSVKEQKQDKDETINVKSMLDMNHVKSTDEQQRIEKGIIVDEGNLETKPEENDKKIIEEQSETFDYLKSKKKTQQEDNIIDTHWKSKREGNALLADDSNEGNETKTKEQEEISTYYKNERNTNLDIDFIQNESMRGKGFKAEDESEFSIEKLRQSAMVDLGIEETSNKKSKSVQQTDEDEDDIYTYTEKQKSIQIEEDQDDLDKKNQEEENIKSEKKKKSQDIEEEQSAKKDKKNNDDNLNHIDAYYKGKVTNQDTTLEEDKEDFIDRPEETFIDDEPNSDLSEKNELEFSKEKDFIDKKNNETESDSDKKNKKPSDNERLEEDAFMRGKLKTSNLEIEDKDFTDKKENLTEKEITSKKPNRDSSLDEDLESNNFAKKENLVEDIKEKSNTKKENIEEDIETDYLQKANKETHLEFDKDQSQNTESEVNEDENHGTNKLQRLAIADINDINGENFDAKKEDASDPKLKKLKNTQFDLEDPSLNHNTGNGKVEQIDKYMRSRESKKEEHDWNLGEKKKDIDLALEKGKEREEELIQKALIKDAGEQTIDYRKLKEEFELLQVGANLPPEELEKLRKMIRGELEDDDSSHRVYIPEPRGVDFLMDIALDLYESNIKTREIFEKIAKKIHAQKGFVTFLQYSKASDLKEAFTIFQLTEQGLISDELRQRFSEMKKDPEFFKSQANYSMSCWRSPEVLDKNNKTWEDTELPQWAPNELHNKVVEYIYPMFDGLDRMGHIYIWFPEGIMYSEAKFIDIILESSRSLYLDQVIRASKNTNQRNEENEGSEDPNEKKGFLGGITSFFGKKKVG